MIVSTENIIEQPTVIIKTFCLLGEFIDGVQSYWAGAQQWVFSLSKLRFINNLFIFIGLSHHHHYDFPTNVR